jgi:tRNA threonylcarbamoyladenosine biosynthesis protein TsaB
MHDLKSVIFDTATDETVVAGSDDGELKFSHREASDDNGRPRHSQGLVEAIEEAAGALGGWSEVDSIAAGCGPGTFTGIRIGLATAEGLSLSSGKPAFGFSTLEAIAFGMSDEASASGQLRLAVIDARRSEVFAALYGLDGEERWEAFVSSPEQLAARLVDLDADVLAGGSGAIRFSDELTRAGATVPAPDAELHRLSPASICDLAGGAGGPEDKSRPLEPIYLRPPDAQLWIQRDTK